jgi:hypothetical protein
MSSLVAGAARGAQGLFLLAFTFAVAPVVLPVWVYGWVTARVASVAPVEDANGKERDERSVQMRLDARQAPHAHAETTVRRASTFPMTWSEHVQRDGASDVRGIARTASSGEATSLDRPTSSR